MLVALLSTTAIAGTRPTTTYRALDLGASTFEVGLVQSAFSVLPALTAVLIGRWIDRHGEGRMYSLSLVVMGLGGLLSAWAESLPVLALGQSIFGLGTIGSLISGQSMITTRSRPEEWNRRLGTYSAFLSMGQLVGPSLAAAIQGVPGLGEDWERIALVAAALSGFGAALLTRMISRWPRGVDAAPVPAGGFFGSVRRVLSRPGMLAAMFVSISVASTLDVLAAYLPVYGTVTGLSVALVGLLLSVRAGATMISRVGMEWLLARLGWGRVLMACLLISAAMLALTPATSIPIVLILIMGTLGLSIGLVQPMTITWVANRAPKPERGTALAVRLTGNRTSLLLVPAIMGAVAGTAGVAAVFWLMAIALGAGSLVTRTARLDRTKDPGGAGTPAPEGAEARTPAAEVPRSEAPAAAETGR